MILWKKNKAVYFSSGSAKQKFPILSEAKSEIGRENEG
jgi:hypothetical protein